MVQWILLVEANKVLRHTYQIQLEKRGYAVTVANNADEAQSYLHPQSPYLCFYNLVLLDLDLPDMNGIDLAHWIREFYSPEELPIVALATVNGYDKKHACLAAGMQDFFTRPLLNNDWDKLLGNFFKHLILI